MTGRCSLDCQHGRTNRHPANVGCSLFRYTNRDLRNHINQRPKRKSWTGEDIQLALLCYFRSNPTQKKGYRKRMMEIWQELSNFQTTSQRLADQVKTIIKVWFSDLEIIEIHHKINNQQCSNNTLPGTSYINKQKQPIRKEPRKMETPHNQTLHNQTTQNNHYHKNKS